MHTNLESFRFLTCVVILGELLEKQCQEPDYPTGQRTPWRITHLHQRKSHRPQDTFKDNGSALLESMINYSMGIYDSE